MTLLSSGSYCRSYWRKRIAGMLQLGGKKKVRHQLTSVTESQEAKAKNKTRQSWSTENNSLCPASRFAWGAFSHSVNPHLKQHNKQIVCACVWVFFLWHIVFVYLFITIIYATCYFFPWLLHLFTPTPQPYIDNYDHTTYLFFVLFIHQNVLRQSKIEILNSERVGRNYGTV